ncbi:protein sidekick-like [Pholidichthys leucotaenia]
MLVLGFSLILCLLLGRASAKTITATVGTDVTLQCKYDAEHYGRLSACWGRGAIPNSGCANEVIKTDGTSVISRLSERYLLMGSLGEGDVSLTIRQVEESDSGMYGCRVEIPGWFNDHKHQVTLAVNAACPSPLKLELREVKERAITVRWSPVFDGGRAITTYRVDLKNKQAPWDTAVRTEVPNSELTQVTLVDLRPFKTYNLRMFAINSVGMSEGSNVLTITTKEAAPEGPPLDMQLQAVSAYSIKVSWKPPKADLRNGVLRGYSISYREYDPVDKQFKRWQHVSVPATQELESIVLKNLRPSTKYMVLIQAKTNAGVGPASSGMLFSSTEEVPETTAWTSPSSPAAATVRINNTTSTTALSQAHSTSTAAALSAATIREQTSTIIVSVPPDPPVVELKEVIDNTVSLLWTPGFEGDSPITGYVLEYKAANALWDYTKNVVDFGPNQTEATIIEINPSTYNIRMFAKNSRRTSSPSNVLTITTGEPVHHKDNPMTTSAYTTAPVSAEERPNGHLVAIIVPVVLVVLIGAAVTVWQFHRTIQKRGSLNMWMTNGGLRYRRSDSVQEL